MSINLRHGPSPPGKRSDQPVLFVLSPAPQSSCQIARHMKYIRVASKLARVVKEINLAILTLKIDNKFLKSPIITEMSEFAFFNFNNIPTRSNPVKIHLNLPAFCSSIFKTTILISGICLKVKTSCFHLHLSHLHKRPTTWWLDEPKGG